MNIHLFPLPNVQRRALSLLLLLFFVFGLSSLTSCSKGRTIRIKAINAATGQPYAGLEYKIASSRTTYNGEKFRTEASGTLNSNGEAAVKIRQKKGRTYHVYVVQPENTCYNKADVQYFDSPYDKDGTFTFEFAGCALLKLHIENQNCAGEEDKMQFQNRTAYTDWPGAGLASWSTERLGCYEYTSPSAFSTPAGLIIYRWRVTRAGITSEFSDSIYLEAGQEGVMNLIY